jgi:hypothetical protein
VFLVFTQAGCGPCKQIMPELSRMSGGDLQILVVNKGDAAAAGQLVSKAQPRFPVLVADGLDLSRKYEAFATPFAFLIDENGIIASRGIISNKQHIAYVLSGAAGAKDPKAANDPSGAERAAPGEAVSHSNASKEVQHV